MSDQELVQVLVTAQTKFQETVCLQLQTWNQENKDAQKRIHERLDQLLSKETVTNDKCEERRITCKSCLRGEIKAVQENSEEKQQTKVVNTQMSLGNIIQAGIFIIGIIAIWIKVG